MKPTMPVVALLLILTLICSTAAAEPANLQSISAAVEHVYRDLERTDGPDESAAIDQKFYGTTDATQFAQ